MASYFDAQPHSKTTAEVAGLASVENGGELAKTSLLSPQVTSILDDLGEHSSSDEEAPSHSDSDQESRGRREDKDQEPLRKAQSSPLPQGSKKATLAPPPRPGLGGSAKHPHLARFHSLRSMLFSSNIEDKMAQCREEEEQAAAEGKWKAEYEQRRGLNRPKTPESPKGSPTKEGFTHRIGNKIKRMTSKDVPTMKEIKEDDNESTASDEEEPHPGNIETAKKWDEELVSDDESIHHSDVEDLVRWVSRRDPPSDGEGRRGRNKGKEIGVTDFGAHEGGHKSLGPEDVDELVKWVTRKDEPKEEEEKLPSDYGDASTASDSEVDDKKPRDLGDDDVDELVRWVSRREGPKAGPVKEKKANPQSSHSTSEANDSDTAELKRWVTGKDDTSGESDVEALSRGRRLEVPREQKSGSLNDDDVDELVRFVSRKDNTVDGTANGKVKQPAEAPKRETLTDGDVDELVKWVSRREDSAQEEERRDDNILKWKEQEDKKKAEIGMSKNGGSLGHEDVDELVKWVSEKK